MNTPTSVEPNKSLEEDSNKVNSIYSEFYGASNIIEVWQQSRDKLLDYLGCEEIVVFALDRPNRQLFSIDFEKNSEEIRVDISRKSLAGFCAATGKPIRISNAKTSEELTSYHPDLNFDSWWSRHLKIDPRSVMALPIPHNKKLVGIMEIFNKKDGTPFSPDDFKRAKELSPSIGVAILKIETQEIEGESVSLKGSSFEKKGEKVQALTQAIHSAKNIDEVIIDLRESMLELFEAKLITIYGVDHSKNEVFSKFKTEKDDISEVRVPISPKSISGCVALLKKPMMISNVYDSQELKRYHPELSFNSSFMKDLKSMMVFPLLFDSQLMGVLQVMRQVEDPPFNSADEKGGELFSKTLSLAFSKMYREEKIRAISVSIHSANNTDDILLKLEDALLDLFQAERLTIYAFDKKSNEVCSKVKSGQAIKEIRVPVSPKSIAGCVATLLKPANLIDVQNDVELTCFHPQLRFDGKWDKASGFTSKAMLVYPLIFQGQLMGIIQLVNKRNGSSFNKQDENTAEIISEVLALGLHNQSKYSQTKKTPFDLLISNGTLSQNELTAANIGARKQKLSPEFVLIKNHGFEKKEIGKSLSQYFNLPFIDLEQPGLIMEDLTSGLNKKELQKELWLPIAINNSKMTVAIVDPENSDIVSKIAMLFPKNDFEFKVCIREDIIDHLSGGKTTSEGFGTRQPIQKIVGNPTEQGLIDVDALIAEMEGGEESSGADANEALTQADNMTAINVQDILADSISQQASDIHFEPAIGNKSITIRFRVDGVCREYQPQTNLSPQDVITILKKMAKLSITDSHLPQDGKFKIKIDNEEIEYKLSTYPTFGQNEDVVLHKIEPLKPIPLKEMNLFSRNLGLIEENLGKPNGMMLFVGPSGSGKTTMVHSCLEHINTPRIKIFTAENPVEIVQRGLRQIQIDEKNGLTYLKAINSLADADADVVFLGELDDKETAGVALETALTGRLIISTLRLNSTIDAIRHMLNLELNPMNLAQGLLQIGAQRFVVTLCKTCKEGYHPDKDEFDQLMQEYGKEGFPKLGIKYTDKIKLYKPAGCGKCNGSGYSGRTCIYEIMQMTPSIKQLIVDKAELKQIQIQAIHEGMNTLKQDGIWKIFRGYCDLKQVLAVCNF
jgi:type II secretory ATPase GspE/PulE/Tfp pilus assembly ATPase PilB-like protein/GAF domain-containing protein